MAYSATWEVLTIQRRLFHLQHTDSPASSTKRLSCHACQEDLQKVRPHCIDDISSKGQGLEVRRPVTARGIAGISLHRSRAAPLLLLPCSERLAVKDSFCFLHMPQLPQH